MSDLFLYFSTIIFPGALLLSVTYLLLKTVEDDGGLLNKIIQTAVDQNTLFQKENLREDVDSITALTERIARNFASFMAVTGALTTNLIYLAISLQKFPNYWKDLIIVLGIGISFLLYINLRTASNDIAVAADSEGAFKRGFYDKRVRLVYVSTLIIVGLDALFFVLGKVGWQ